MIGFSSIFQQFRTLSLEKMYFLRMSIPSWKKKFVYATQFFSWSIHMYLSKNDEFEATHVFWKQKWAYEKNIFLFFIENNAFSQHYEICVLWGENMHRTTVRNEKKIVFHNFDATRKIWLYSFVMWRNRKKKLVFVYIRRC